jgi:hypothetical protein
MSTFSIQPTYKGDNQWTIHYTNKDFERTFTNLYELEVVSLYHCVAKALGLDYQQSEIDRTTNAITSFGSHKNVKWTIHDTWGTNQVELMHYTDSGCPKTYGAINKEILTDIIKYLGEWLKENDIHILSYNNLKTQWLSHLKMGIGIRVYPMYQHLYDADEDFSAEKLAQYKLEKAISSWESASELAFTILDQPITECVTKVSMSRKNLIFYIKNGNRYFQRTYPPFHELKDDKLFIKMLKAYSTFSATLSAEDIDKWVNSNMDIPNFPLYHICNTDYPNFSQFDY